MPRGAGSGTGSLLCRVFYAELRADGVHGPGHPEAEGVAHFGAFGQPCGKTGHYFLYLIFEAVDHGFELDGLGWLALFVPGKLIIFIPGCREPDHAGGACYFGSDACLTQ